MGVKKIVLFAPLKSQDSIMDGFTEELSQALNRQGVHCRILYSHKDKPGAFIDALLHDRPDCTLSFNGLLPDDKGNFLADLLKIPHVACLVASPNHFFELAKSPYTIITSIDRDFCEFFNELRCPNVLFFPPAADRSLASDTQIKQIYDVLLLSSFIDYEAIQKQWKVKYPPALCKLLEETVEMTLSDAQKSYIQAFVEALDRTLRTSEPLDPLSFNLPELFDEIAGYVRGKDRIELVKAIQDTNILIVGKDNTEANWGKFLGKNANKRIVFQDEVPYGEALNLMKQSKIVLNSSPCYKNGSNARIFNGLACGAAVVTSKSAYVSEIFADGKDMIFYEVNHWDAVNAKIQDLLADEDKRHAMVNKGREVIMQGQTWDDRAKKLLKELAPILNKLKSE